MSASEKMKKMRGRTPISAGTRAGAKGRGRVEARWREERKGRGKQEDSYAEGKEGEEEEEEKNKKTRGDWPSAPLLARRTRSTRPVFFHPDAMLNEVLPGGRKSCSALRSQAFSPSLSNESPSWWTNFDYDKEGSMEKNNRIGGLIEDTIFWIKKNLYWRIVGNLFIFIFREDQVEYHHPCETNETWTCVGEDRERERERKKWTIE